MTRLLAIAVTMLTLAGCKTLKFWDKDKKEVKPAGNAAADPAAREPARPEEGGPTLSYGETPRELELKIAKLWARVDEMEHDFFKQRERLKLLENGLMLGVVPEELKREKAPRGKKGAAVLPHEEEEVVMQIPPAAHQTQATNGVEGAAVSAPRQDDKAYQIKLAHAQGLFNGGHYGQAILAFSEIGKEFPAEQTGGNHLYWTGVSWFHLKEYQLATQSLELFAKEHAASPWVPKAKLYMARTHAQMGMGDKAMKGLRAIIQEYPEDETAEMAKLEIKRLEDRL